MPSTYTHCDSFFRLFVSFLFSARTKMWIPYAIRWHFSFDFVSNTGRIVDGSPVGSGRFAQRTFRNCHKLKEKWKKLRNGVNIITDVTCESIHVDEAYFER